MRQTYRRESIGWRACYVRLASPPGLTAFGGANIANATIGEAR